MRILAGCVLTCLLASPAAAQPSNEEAMVDLELVLAVDVSYSMDLDEQRLQRNGYVSAIASQPVIAAIRSGIYGRIAVTYVEWAGAAQQSVVVDWQIIEDEASARRFADKLASAPASRSFRTSISTALSFAATLFGRTPYDGVRKVIDVSGDGPNNQGRPVTAARDAVVAQGIVINGLPLNLKEQTNTMLDISGLDAYYRDCVIGGPGSFVVPVNGEQQFTEAVRTKLIMEIAGIEPPPRVIRTQAGADCGIGERMWQERYGQYGEDFN
jgi:hypothetical protein